MPEQSKALAFDCEIDDPQLLAEKKHLTTRGQPLTIMESLKGKHKALSFQELLEPGKDPATGKAFFTVTWCLKGYPSIQGVSQDFNKQKARHLAAQRMLKALFFNP